MSRFVGTEHVCSGTVDDCYNDCETSVQPTQQEEISSQHHIRTTIEANPLEGKIQTRSQSSRKQKATCLQLSLSEQTEQGQIHTISSSDEDEFVIEHNSIEEITNVSSNELEDFKGFDDFTTPNNSGFINDTSLDDHNVSRNCLKRFSNLDFDDYCEDSEDIVEAIEVDDEDASIGSNQNKSREEILPNKCQKNRCEQHTFYKRKKQENDILYNDATPTHIRTAPDQIVEINSDSTTNSLKQKRKQIINKFQTNLSPHLIHTDNINVNKCSTESTSEFPVSSPSNPQQPIGGKYLTRPPLLKNTLPADSFERQLAFLNTCNPQMTLAEKIQSWDCNDELSDVEDVYKFDEKFKLLEKKNKLGMKQKEKGDRFKKSDMKNYDFLTFRLLILSKMKEQQNQKFYTGGQRTNALSGSKCMQTSDSESSISVIYADVRPSTSAVAQQQLQQRRSKLQVNLETGELKKRVVKEVVKRNQNSTTPPQTSSSENEKDCFKNAKTHTGQEKLSPRQLQVHNKLCHSSSEEAISQDVPSHVLLKANKLVCKKSPNSSLPLLVNSDEKRIIKKNSRTLTDEEIDSVFRLHRINRERDKPNSFLNSTDDRPNSIIQMRLDFGNENKTELSMEKKHELFKTPFVPQKYLANESLISENQRKIINSPSETSVTNEKCKRETSQTITCKKLNSSSIVQEVKSKSNCEEIDKNSERSDIDGVYHQQHEFCNYLGLTGMSTATAMANAVAELAQCNLARRSMRVLRQQKERKDKTVKEERKLEALKSKQHSHLRKRKKVDCDNVSQLETVVTANKSDECSHSRTSEGTTSIMESNKKTSNNSTTKSSTISQHSVTIVKKKPEIKILCHISTNNKEGSERVSKVISQPIRGSLMRHVKQIKSYRVPKHCGENSKEQMNIGEKYENEMNNKSILVNKEIKTFFIEREESLEKKASKRLKSVLTTAKERSHINETQKDQICTHETPSLVGKSKLLVDTISTKKRLEIHSGSLFAKVEDPKKNDDVGGNDTNLSTPNRNFIEPASSIIQQKIQMALKESRKSKPSIFIVQSFESKKDNSSKLQEQSENKTALSPNKVPVRGEIIATLKKSPNKISGKPKRKNRKGEKHPTFRRQLRKRKIIVIKTTKPKKSYAGLSEFKRELRSSPKTKGNSNIYSLEDKDPKIEKYKTGSQTECNETKSYRSIHTETSDLELFLNRYNSQTKTQLMAKASALLERSRRMMLRIRRNSVNRKYKPKSKMQRSKQILHNTKPEVLNLTIKRLENRTKHNSKFKFPLLPSPVLENKVVQATVTSLPVHDNDNVVVSSTTNTYDERPSQESLVIQSSVTLRSIHNNAPYVIASSPIETKEQFTQCSIINRIQYLNTPPLITKSMRNPLKSDYGLVLYIYYESDILIVIQERLVSFWKCSKLINILTLLPPNKLNCNHQMNNGTTSPKQHNFERCNNHVRQPVYSSVLTDSNACCEWIQMGELRRLNYDFEISVPYANRICLHNSTPIYLEMRAQQLPKNNRDCNLLSMYINIYYYHDEDMIAKCNSIQLDTIQSDIKSVNYTTLIDSRYFIMTWPQENILGKTRSGLCKYSLTPQLDTLASIREFKSMRHAIHYIQCMNDDKLIGFGDTQVTIWDHRSGDVLMNFDLEIPMGKNLGSTYFSGKDIEQNNTIILHQYRDFESDTPPVLMIIACTITHTHPSYRVLQEINLPIPAFKVIKNAINTGDHLVIFGQNDDELWISTTNPTLITIISNKEKSKRFYNRERSQLIELTDETLNANSLSNYILQLAADHALK